MLHSILFSLAATYFLLTFGRAFLMVRPSPRFAAFLPWCERAAYILLSTGLVFYVQAVQWHNIPVHSLTWFLFAWALHTTQLFSELVFRNRYTFLFCNLWVALAALVMLLPTVLNFPMLEGLLSNNVAWLKFHRIVILLGYSFCLLTFPIAIRFLWIGNASTYVEAAMLDRTQYHLILWALPLLTLGILVEAGTLMQRNAFPNPFDLLQSRREELLALLTWFLCGIYLHTRLFYSWRNRRSALLYFAGMLIILAGHFVNP